MTSDIDNTAQLATHAEQIKTIFSMQHKFEESMSQIASNVAKLSEATSVLAESQKSSFAHSRETQFSIIADIAELRDMDKKLHDEIIEFKTRGSKRYDHITLAAISGVITSLVAAAMAIFFR